MATVVPATPALLAALRAAGPGDNPPPRRAIPALVAILAAMQGRQFRAAALAPDLATAIVSRFAAAGLGTVLTGISRDNAGAKAVYPYLLFSLSSATLIRADSEGKWYDERIRFTVVHTDPDQANALRDRVWVAYQGQPYDFAGGYSIPFVLVNRSESREPDRTMNNQLFFKATLDVSARTERGI